MKLHVLSTIYLFLCFGIMTDCFGQTVLAWKTENEITGNQNSTTTHSLLEQGVLSRGSGVLYSDKSTYTYTGSFPVAATKAEAIAANGYYQITLKGKPGVLLSLSGLTARLRRASIKTANKYCWMYSLNGTDFNDVGPAEVILPDTFPSTNNGVVQEPVDLSAISDLQNVPSGTQITFRLYAWGGAEQAVAANLGFGKSYYSSTANNPIVFTGVATMPVAQTPIATWRPPSSIETALAATEADVNINQANLSRGSGLTYSSSSTYTYTSNFPVNATKADAVSANAYYEVKMQAKSGYYLNLSGLTSRLRRSHTTSPGVYRWAYSLDGTTFTEVGPGDVTLNMIAGDDTNGEDQYLIDLSGIAALKNIPSTVELTFRLYAWGGTANTSNMGLGKSYVNATSTSYNSLVFYGSVLNTLPVKLVSFTAKNEGGVIKLNWKTATEKNNERFEVLRSSESKPQIAIGTLKGQGTSNEIHSYNFTDRSPVPGTNYYQLSQVDADGSTELSEIIAVSDKPGKAALKVVTSANELKAYIFSPVSGTATFRLSDVSGRTLATKTVTLKSSSNNEIIVPVNDSTGVFIASLVLPDGQKINTKFFK